MIRPGVAKDFKDSTVEDDMGGKENKCGDSITSRTEF